MTTPIYFTQDFMDIAKYIIYTAALMMVGG